MSDSLLPSVGMTESSALDAASDEVSTQISVTEAPGPESTGFGTAVLRGQAAAPVTLAPPAPGETLVVAPQAGAIYVLDFMPQDATVESDGGNLVFVFDDSGDGSADRQIVFENLAELTGEGEAPTFQIAGTSFSTDVLFNQAQALAGASDPLETAADAGEALGGGATVYSDNLGNLIELLQALGVIPPTELEFGLIDPEDDIDLVLLGEEIPAAPELLINEIGLRLPPSVLPGGPPGVDNVFVDFVEFYNPSDSAINTLDLTVELLNPAGDVISMAIPNGFEIPAGGFLVLYEQSAQGEGGVVTLVSGFILDADGALVNAFVLPGVAPWELGSDVTEAIGVNLVFQAGSENETGVDTFAANLPAADLGVFSSPTWVSNETAPDLFPDANFETFFGGLSPSQNIFSRAFDENDPTSGAPIDSDTEADWTTNNTSTTGQLNNTALTDEGALLINADNGSEGLVHVSSDGSITVLVTTQDILDATGAGDVGLLNKAIAVGDDGSIYFAEFFSQSILRLPPDGPLEVFISGADVSAVTGVGAGYLRGLLFGPDGLMYVVDDESGSILRIDPAVEPATIDIFANISGMPEFATGIEELIGLIISADGTSLYLAVDADDGAGADAIVEIDIATGATSILATDVDFNKLTFMVLAPNGDLIVADAGFDDELFRVTPDGVVSVFLSGADLDAITGVPATNLQAGFWFDDAGNFYIGDGETDTIYRFDSVDPVTGEVDPASGVPLVLPADVIAALGGAGLQAGALELPFLLDVLGFTDPNPSDPMFDDLNPQQANDEPLAGQTILTATDPNGELLEGFGGSDALFGASGDDTVYGGSQAMVAEQGALNTEDPGVAPAEGFSDHNDFLFGDAGNDALYGGSGGDYIVGGLDSDTVDGGSGNDFIFGHDAPIGGVPEGDPGDAAANGDLLAGDGLNNQGAGVATINLGGDDIIYGGFGHDSMAGEAVAVNAEGGADAFALNVGELTLSDPDGNDALYGAEGEDVMAGEVLGIGLGDVEAIGQNVSDVFAAVGSDWLEGGDEDDMLAGEAMALSQEGIAEAWSASDATGSGIAGNDTLLGGAGADTLAGEVFAEGQEAFAGVYDTVVGGQGSNDSLDGGAGSNVMAGEAYAFATGQAEAYVEFDASEGGIVGSDSIDGAGTLSGEIVAVSEADAVAEVFFQASTGAIAGNDTITADGLESGFVAGEVLAFGNGSANVIANMIAGGAGSEAGNDDMSLAGVAVAAGDIVAGSSGDISVTMNASASDGASAASDTLTGGLVAGLAGDVALLPSGGLVTVDLTLDGTAGAGNTNVGFDSVVGGDLDQVIAGEVLVVGNAAAGSSVTVSSSSDGLGFVGSDVINAGGGDNTVAGDVVFFGDGASTATVNNTIDAGATDADVGSDVIEADDGANVVAGDVLGSGDAALSVEVINTANGGGSVGSDRITVGNGGLTGNRIAGDALALGGAVATVTNTNNAGVPEDARVGSDTIESGDGNDTLAGDAAAFDGGDATVTNSAAAGNDEITAGAGNDVVSGDAFSDGGDADASGGGDDTIDGGDGNDLIAGDALAVNGGTATSTNGGDDLILAGDGNDTVYGDSNGTDVNGGNDTIDGGAGDDSIFGNSGDDELLGGDGVDTISDGEGADLIVGGALGDIINLSADGDSDTVAYLDIGDAGDVVEGFDAITAVAAGGDVLDLSDLLASGTFAGANLGEAMLDGFVDLVDTGADIEVHVDLNGNGNDYSLLVTLNNVNSVLDLENNIVVV